MMENKPIKLSAEQMEVQLVGSAIPKDNTSLNILKWHLRHLFWDMESDLLKAA